MLTFIGYKQTNKQSIYLYAFGKSFKIKIQLQKKQSILFCFFLSLYITMRLKFAKKVKINTIKKKE